MVTAVGWVSPLVLVPEAGGGGETRDLIVGSLPLPLFSSHSSSFAAISLQIAPKEERNGGGKRSARAVGPGGVVHTLHSWLNGTPLSCPTPL